MKSLLKNFHNIIFFCHTLHTVCLYKNMACISMERTEDKNGFPDAMAVS